MPKVKKVKDIEKQGITGELNDIQVNNKSLFCTHNNQLDKGAGVIVCNDCNSQLKP